MAHEAVASISQDSTNAGRLDPAFDPGPGAFVGEVARDRAEPDAASFEGVCHFGQWAGAAIGEPLTRVEGGVVHRFGGLEVQYQHVGLGPLGDG